MESRNRMKKKHINDVQTSTVDEHFQLLLEEKNFIDSKHMNNTSSVTPADLPDWFNEKLFKEAQHFYNQNTMAMAVSSIMGLFAILAIPDILKVLIFTKKSNIPHIAFNRYIETLLHIHNLYTCDPNDPDSNMLHQLLLFLVQTSTVDKHFQLLVEEKNFIESKHINNTSLVTPVNWYKTVNVITRKHQISSERSKKACVGGIYQKDMALTQFAFLGYVFIAPKSIGLLNKPEEDEALNHFWRVVGYMLGIPDRLNICRKTAVETHELCQKISSDILVNYLNEAPPDFYHIVSIISNGLWYIDVTLNADALLSFIYRLHGIKYKKPLTWYSWLNMKYRDLTFYLCLVPYIGTVVKTYYNYMLIFTLWLVQKWPVHAWWSFGKENCQIKLYPTYI